MEALDMRPSRSCDGRCKQLIHCPNGASVLQRLSTGDVQLHVMIA